MKDPFKNLLFIRHCRDNTPPAFGDTFPGIKIFIDYSEGLENLLRIDTLRLEDQMISFIMGKIFIGDTPFGLYFSIKRCSGNGN